MVVMSPRLLVLAIVPLVATATAHAQAPGEMAPSEPQPGAQVPGTGAGSSVMARRWAIGLSIGSLQLAPEDNPEAQTRFETAQLSVRYRATRTIELELALAGGAEKYEDGSDGELATNGGTIGARYRFRPEERWNWWLMAGVGATVVARKDSTPEEREQLYRPHGTIGIGLEYRWTAFALGAELRGISIGANDNETMAFPEPDPRGGMTLPPGYATAPVGPQSGGSVSIGASYYF
jgi:hypothetical protein